MTTSKHPHPHRINRPFQFFRFVLGVRAPGKIDFLDQSLHLFPPSYKQNDHVTIGSGVGLKPVLRPLIFIFQSNAIDNKINLT